jgi:hypothetical protein
MLNQGQGTYPQLAGSFYNSQQMMPHDNGRNARQVPTFFGGLQNMMSASTAMQNYQGVPMGQGILNTQALASQRYNQGMSGVIGGVGTGLGLASMVGSVGGYAAGKAITAGIMPGFMGSLGTGFGVLAGAAVGGTMAVGGAAALGIVHSYKKRMSAINDMRNALEGSRMGYGLADPVTGNIGNQAALNLSRQMQSSARGSGFKDNDLKNVMGTASGMGMLNGMQSLSQVTKRVVALAKASKEIVMLGEGISMTDAMQLQKLTQDMGISTNKFRSSNIGKNLVMAARASSMSMDQAAQVGGMGAATYQQLGLGAASGMNAALYGNMASAGLMGVGAFNPRQLAALGGQQGVAQSLLAGQASTMGRMSDSLVMGAVKLGEDGSLGINRELLDQYTRGEVSREDLISRGKNLGKGMSKGRRARLMEELQFSMPRLREDMSDSLSSEEQMAISTRGILELKSKTGMSTRKAAHAYFQNANEAEAYLGYAQNFGAVRGENNRQLAMADQEKMLRYAGMAKSSSGLAQAGRGISNLLSGIGSGIYVGSGMEAAGEYMADVTAREQDDTHRGLRRIMGVSNTVRGAGDLQDLSSYGGSLAGMSRRRSHLEKTGATSYADYYRRFVKGKGSGALSDYERRTGQTSGVNVIGNAGIGQKIEELTEGDFNFSRKFGDWTGIDLGYDSPRIYELQAEATDSSILIGKLSRSRNFPMNDNVARSHYNKAVARLRDIGMKAEAGDEVGDSDFYGVDSREITPEKLREHLGYVNATTSEERDKIDAAIGQAYRFMQSGDSGKSQIGFSLMLEKVSAAGNLHFLKDEIEGKVDEVKLGKGKILRSAGLSRAIQESGVGAGDLSKLVNQFATGGNKLLGYGGAKASLNTILKRAGVNVGKGGAGRYRGLIDALSQAQVESKGKDGKDLITDLAGGIEGFGGTDADIASLVSSGALSQQKGVYLREQLDLLDARIAEGVVGEEGKGLREDLGRNIYATDKEMSYSAARAMKAANFQPETRDIYAKKAVQRRKLELTTKWMKGGSGDQALEDASTASRIYKVSGKLRTIDKNTPEYKKYKRLLSSRARDKYTAEQLEDTSSATYKEELNRRADAFYENASKSEWAKGEYGESKGLGGFSSLSSMFKAIGNSPEEKAAYAKLLDSKGGAGLITSFRKMRRGYGEATASQKRSMDQQMLREIVAAAERQKINVPGSGQSKSLPELLAEIALGIKDFRGAMSSIAKLSKTADGTVTFKLVEKGE